MSPEPKSADSRGSGDLAGQVALITGGGTGIGAAVAERFVAEGMHVLITGRRAEALQKVADRVGALAVPGDAGDTADAEEAVATARREFGRLDVLIANAGGHGFAAALETDDDTWHTDLHANLTTAFVTARAALPELIERRGSIVLVSSLAGLAAGPDVAGYTATKHGVIGLGRSLARDYGPRGVRVNTVCPGWVRTPMADEEMDELVGAGSAQSRESAYHKVTEDVPLRRPADPSEIASVCRFLASPEASILTGAVLPADGGASVVDVPTLAFGR